MALHQHQLTVANVAVETEHARSVEFAVPAKLREAFAFEPGQYLTLIAQIAGSQVRRTYSIHTPAGSDPQVLVKRIAKGAFSGFVCDKLAAGAKLSVLPPAGTFGAGLDFTRTGRYLAAAAGSGITPVISILESALAGNPASTASLIYGNRTTSSIIFRERLADLKDRFVDRFQLIHVLTGEKPDNPLLAGRLQRAKFAKLFATMVPLAQFDHFLTCGPDAMSAAFIAAAGEHGIDEEAIRRELFDAPKSAAKAGKKSARKSYAGSSTLEVVLDGVQRTVTCNADQTILEAACAAGLDVPYACQGGVCSTCRAKLLAGKVAMDANYALRKSEIAAGQILTCQSRPQTSAVTVDYDAAWGS